ncbi:MAG: VirB4 family type IV secretion system protein [Clostridia bacterium]
MPKLFGKKKEVQQDNDKPKQENIQNTKQKVKKKPVFLSNMKTVKDVICCKNVNPLPDDHIQIINAKKIYARTLYVSELPRRSSFAYTFEPILKYGHCNVSIFIRPVREGKSIKELNDTIVDLDSERIMAHGKDINRERRLTKLLGEAESLAEAIDSGENSLFEVSVLITLHAESYEKLNKLTDDLRNKAKERSVLLSSPYADQERAFLSNLPINNNLIGYYHMMDKYSVATLFHYTKGKFGHKKGATLGRNMDTHQLVSYYLFDRTMNAYNLIISGMTRSGKSVTVKLLALRSCTPGGIEFIALDPEGEYGFLAEALNGVNIEISNESNTIINPFELDVEYKKDKYTGNDIPYMDLTEKISIVTYNILTMARGSDPENAPVNEITRGIISDVVKEVYSKRGFSHGDVESLYIPGTRQKKEMPTLGDWYNELLSREAQYESPTFKPHYDYLMIVMKDYVRSQKGTRLYFDGQSTVGKYLKPGTPFVNFDIHLLHEKYERPIVQSILIDWMWECRIKKNSEDPLKARQLVAFFDETHYLLPYKEARISLTNFYRRAGKKNVATVTATQRLNDYLQYEDCHAIFTNATTKILLRHDIKERDALKTLMNVTDVEAENIISANKGEVYVVSGNSKAFVKIDILPSEQLIVETDMGIRQELAKQQVDQQDNDSTKRVN